METIKFDNKEYVWQEVKGKGKCLVPYTPTDELQYNAFDILLTMTAPKVKYGHMFEVQMHGECLVVQCDYDKFILINHTGNRVFFEPLGIKEFVERHNKVTKARYIGICKGFLVKG